MLRLATMRRERFTQAREFEVTYGGGECNVAVSLAHFGVDSIFITAIPDNDIGQACINYIRQFGVDTTEILRQGRRLGTYYFESGAAMRASKVIYDRAASSIAEIKPGEIDWERLLQATRVWRLALPVRRALARVEDEFGPVCPPSVRLRLGELRVNWRDRLALWQAPRDRDHPASHVAVNLLCTPGPRFVLGYLLAMVLPDRGHMGEWYIRRHRGWLACAHLLRWMGPLLRRIPRFWTRLSKIKTGRSAVHGTGVLATREISAGELIARYRGRPVEHDGPYVVWHKTPSGGTRGVELTGKLRFLNHRCRPNADLHEFKLIARTHIGAGREIFIDYGEGTCDCRRVVRQAT